MHTKSFQLELLFSFYFWICFCLLKYSWFTILYLFQVYNIVIWYFYRLHTIQSYYKILIIFPMLHITSLWLIYFITGSFYLLILFICFSPPPSPLPSGNGMFVLCICKFVSVLLYLLLCSGFFFFFLNFTYKWKQSVCLSLSGIRMIFHINTRFHSFYDWVDFHSVYVPHFLYSFICQWIFRLLPCLGYCDWFCYEHGGTCIVLNYNLCLDICPGMGLLDHMATRLLTFFFLP